MQNEVNEAPVTPVLSDQFLITKEFASAIDFSMFIEDTAIRNGATLIDTIIAYCDDHDIDVDVTSKLITKSLKEKIYNEFVDLNMIRNDHGVLDL